MMSFIGASWLHQLLDHAGPRHRPRPLVAGIAERSGTRRVGRERANGFAERLGLRGRDAAVLAVDDELVRSAGVGRRHDRLAGQKRLERDVAVVLVVRRKDYSERAAVELDDLVVGDRAQESDAVGQARASRRALRARRGPCRRLR